MAAAYPATLDVPCPEKLPRDQAILHIVIAIVFYWLAGGILGFLAYIVAPIVIALRVNQKGGEKFVQEDGAEFARYGKLFMAIYAYVYFLTDDPPEKAIEATVKVDFQPTGNPTWLHALFTQILLIPHFLVLGLLGLAFILILPWTIVVALANEQYPKQFYDFVLGYLRWQTRVTAYLFSLTQEYPPFAF
ncbi:MAG: DUF4389 domain-containing protein [Chloroflexota bacterium]|nr:DUF4389 domain-containing protein [Chloroflexota bacterium]